jgi:WD40 repeat protein
MTEAAPWAGHDGRIVACAFGAGGKSVISAAEDDTIRIWTEDGQESRRHRFRADASPFHVNAISLDGSVVLSCPETKVGVWDSATGKRRHELKSKGLAPTACAASADGSLAVVGSLDAVRVWDASKGRFLMEASDEGAKACAISQDCRLVAYGGFGMEMTVWAYLEDESEGFATFRACRTSAVACCFSPDQRFVVFAYDQASVLQVMDPTDGHELLRLDGHAGHVKACCVSPDGQFIASGTDDLKITVWNAATGQSMVTWPLPGVPTALAFHPSAPQLVCGDNTGGLHLLELLGLEYGPVAATARDAGRALALRCPVCGQDLDIDRTKLGSEIACTSPLCRRRIRVNRSVIPKL